MLTTTQMLLQGLNAGPAVSESVSPGVRLAQSKFAAKKNARVLRQVFVAQAEIFHKSQSEELVVKEAFKKIDADSSGFIDAAELRAITVELKLPMSEAELSAALLIMDGNGDNEIEFDGASAAANCLRQCPPDGCPEPKRFLLFRAEFRGWWLLQSTKEGNSAMKVFKQRLEEVVERGRLDIDFKTFTDLCFECKLGADPAGAKMKAATGLVPILDQEKIYRREADPNRELPGEEWKSRPFLIEMFLSAMKSLSSLLFDHESPEQALDKLVRRIQQSGSARAEQFCERAEADYRDQNYNTAEQLFSTAIDLDDERHDYFSRRATTRAAKQDWDHALEDAVRVIEHVDRYNSGVLDTEELKSLASLHMLGENCYHEPAWLTAQLAQHSRGSTSPVCSGGGRSSRASSSWALARDGTRPSTPELIRSLHPAVAKKSVAAPLVDYAASLVSVRNPRLPGGGGAAALPEELTESSATEAFRVIRAQSGRTNSAAVDEVGVEEILECVAAAGVELSAAEVDTVRAQFRAETVSTAEFVDVVKSHHRPMSPTRVADARARKFQGTNGRARRSSVNVEAKLGETEDFATAGKIVKIATASPLKGRLHPRRGTRSSGGGSAISAKMTMSADSVDFSC